MSNRTLIEFNHDLWRRIDGEPEAFAVAILELLRAGSSPRSVEPLERYGATVVGTRHHTEPVRIEYKYRKVNL